MNPVEMFRKKFETYRKIVDESGEQQAWDTLFQGYPERQRKHMGEFIEHTSMAEGFTKAIPIYRQLGMEMEVVDISNKGMDAVLEVQKVCPVLEMAKEFGFEKPCRIICEMDVAATRKGFADQGMTGTILCTQAEGHAVCLFKYERAKRD